MLVEQCQNISVNEVVRRATRNAKQELVASGIQVDECAIRLTTTETQFGGQRVWFICPSCARRCGVLRKHPLSGAVGCRDCLGVDYRKQRFKGMIELTR